MRYLLFVLGFFMAFAGYSQTIKLKITGITDVAGEDVIAFEAGDTTTVTTGGGGGTSSVAKFSLVKIKKLQGTSTNELFKRSINATHTAEMSFEFYNASNDLYYKIVLKDVVISHFSYLSPECSGCSKLFHQLWLDYRKIEVTDIATGNTTRYDLATKAFY